MGSLFPSFFEQYSNRLDPRSLNEEVTRWWFRSRWYSFCFN